MSSATSSGVAEVLRDAGAGPQRLLGVGIGVPGIVERGTGGPDGKAPVVHGQTVGWDAVPFEELLRGADWRPRCRCSSRTAPGRWGGPRCGSAAGAARAAVVVLFGSGVGACVDHATPRRGAQGVRWSGGT
ncbi:ROK family transcriptional regulator OS=Streptomyces microflavus OX=1919 GN=HUT09_31665 PE=3 SV=1 [Streptomyces microflavus]